MQSCLGKKISSNQEVVQSISESLRGLWFTGGSQDAMAIGM